MSGRSPALRQYTTSDLPAILDLWSTAMGSAFPLCDDVLRQCLESDGTPRPSVIADCALIDEELVGFGYLTWRDRATPESFHSRLQAVVVHPAHQRRGIGSTLARHLLSAATARGATTAEAGGGLDYLWPAVPIDLPGATSFIESLGFALGGTSYDLRSTLTTAELCRNHAARLACLGIRIEAAPYESIPALLEVIGREFDADWAVTISEFLEARGRPSDLLMAVGPEGVIAGFVRIHTLDSRPAGPPLYWSALRGPEAGGLGPIGVSTAWRGRGLGTALVAGAVVELARRGATDVVIDFTDLLSFYGTLGFMPWMSFRHATRATGLEVQ